VFPAQEDCEEHAVDLKLALNCLRKRLVWRLAAGQRT
jgi:hypothetical protein